MRTAKWLRTGLVAVSMVSGAATAVAQVDQLVSNVEVEQHPFTALVDVTYDLETVNGISVTVKLYLSSDSGSTYPHLCLQVTGDVGEGVSPGTGKHLVWDAGAELGGFSSATCRLRVTADDGQADFVTIPPGTFLMGSSPTETGHLPNEIQHQVTLTHGFYMQATEVTNQQYMEMAQWAYDHGYVTVTTTGLYDNLDGSVQLMKALGTGNYEITFSGGVFSCTNPTHPVKHVTWYGSVAYCDWLSLQQGLPRAYNHSTWQCNAGNPYATTGYRLPTEAEWEYACRAGTQTPFNTGSCLDAGTQANYNGGYPYSECPVGPFLGWTVSVGSYPANAFGLLDMHGNLFEWCNDWDGPYGGTVTDPVGAGTGSRRVARGGGWGYFEENCRSAYRDDGYQYIWYSYIGFRPVRSTS